jgi:hypothetical protein
MKKIFTKEMAGNAILMFGVVIVALAVNEKFIKPRISGGNGMASTPAPASTTSATTEA